jgi:hypothetical protein
VVEPHGRVGDFAGLEWLRSRQRVEGVLFMGRVARYREFIKRPRESTFSCSTPVRGTRVGG